MSQILGNGMTWMSIASWTNVENWIAKVGLAPRGKPVVRAGHHTFALSASPGLEVY
jgi:hypothetical protein